MKIKIKRVYEKAAKNDGRRILVDRVWPRGMSKQAARIDLWLKDIAPSTALRRWFGHDPLKWPKFKKRYFKELAKNPEALKPLRAPAGKGTVTLVFGAREERFNNAVALKQYLGR
ncbi:MAG: DUF488 domain-containing protein [Sulfuricaulis sp.]